MSAKTKKEAIEWALAEVPGVVWAKDNGGHVAVYVEASHFDEASTSIASKVGSSGEMMIPYGTAQLRGRHRYFADVYSCAKDLQGHADDDVRRVAGHLRAIALNQPAKPATNLKGNAKELRRLAALVASPDGLVVIADQLERLADSFSGA